MIKLCIFDLDGTLIDSLDDLACAMNNALKLSGFPAHENEKYRMMVGNGISVLTDRAACAPNEKYTPEVKEAILSDFKEYYRLHCMDHTRPYNGINSVLDSLTEAGILYAVNSNKPDFFSKKIVDALFPDKHFAHIRGKLDGAECKPAPDGAFAIMRALKVSADDTIYIGDSSVDIQTAKNAGLISVGVTWGFRTREELMSAGADHIVSSPEELISLILSL